MGPWGGGVAGIEAGASAGFGDAHGAAQLVEDLDFGFERNDRFLEGGILPEFLQRPGQLVQGTTVLPWTRPGKVVERVEEGGSQ